MGQQVRDLNLKSELKMPQWYFREAALFPVKIFLSSFSTVFRCRSSGLLENGDE